MKKTIIALAALASLGISMATPFVASAQDIGKNNQNLISQREYRHRARYEVYYRRVDGRRWRLEGSYRDRDDAARVARRLERRGYVARVERIGDSRDD